MARTPKLTHAKIQARSRDIAGDVDANSVAVALDDEEWPEVVGTLAGDDTIVVIAPDNATAETVRTKFLGMIERTG